MKKVVHFLLLLVCGSFAVHGMEIDKELDTQIDKTYLSLVPECLLNRIASQYINPNKELDDKPEFTYKYADVDPNEKLYEESAFSDKLNILAQLVSVSSTGEHVAIVDGKEQVKVFDTKNKKTLFIYKDKYMVHHSFNDEYPLQTVAFGPKEKRIAIAYNNYRVVIGDIPNKQILGEYKHGNHLNSVAFDSTGKYVVSSCENREVIVFDIQKKQKICEYQHSLCKDKVASFNPTGEYVVIGDNNRLFDIKKKQIVKKVSLLNRHLYSRRRNPRSDYSVRVEDDKKKVVVFDYCNEKTIYECEHIDRVSSVGFSPAKKFLGIADYKGNLVVKNLLKSVVSQNLPKKISAHKEYLLWLLLHKEKMPTKINQSQKNLFEKIPDMVKNLFTLKEIESEEDKQSMWQLDEK